MEINMKKLSLVSVIFCLATSFAYAGVSKISSNGDVSGVPSYSVKCSSGSDYIIYHKNGTWYRGDIGHMGNKYDSWSVDQVANFVCN